MITGIGTDIIEIDRMRAAWARRGMGLARRLLSASELTALLDQADPARFLAKRFAAKEALLKALGTGLRRGLRWTDMGVVNDTDGKPLLQLAGEAARLVGDRHCHLSLTDERHYAVAFVIIESAS
ncbi:MAG: holo-ACP synthase [Alcanivoracaceae bacterium]